MPTKKKGAAFRVSIDRRLPKKMQLRHASLLVRLERAKAGPAKTGGTGPGSGMAARTLVEAFNHGVYCGQTAQLLDDATQYLHDNWNQIPQATRDAMEKQIVNVLNNYANNC